MTLLIKVLKLLGHLLCFWSTECNVYCCKWSQFVNCARIHNSNDYEKEKTKDQDCWGTGTVYSEYRVALKAPFSFFFLPTPLLFNTGCRPALPSLWQGVQHLVTINNVLQMLPHADNMTQASLFTVQYISYSPFSMCIGQSHNVLDLDKLEEETRTQNVP